MKRIIFALFALAFSAAASAGGNSESLDLGVYGGSSAGLAGGAGTHYGTAGFIGGVVSGNHSRVQLWTGRNDTVVKGESKSYVFGGGKVWSYGYGSEAGFELGGNAYGSYRGRYTDESSCYYCY